MIERRGCARLLFESADAVGVAREFGRQYFDGDIPVKPLIVSAIDHAHAATSQRREDLIDADPLADGYWRVRRSQILGFTLPGGDEQRVFFEEAIRRGVMTQQQFDLAAQVRVVWTGGEQERRGGLFLRQPAEETQFYDLRFARVNPGQGAQRFVERH